MYCTVEEVRNFLKEDAINSIIMNEYIDDPEEKEAKLLPLIEQAIDDADGEIDGYLASRYPTPLKKVPKVINKYSKDIAVYNLFSRAGLDEGERENNYLTRYKAAIKFLELVAKGTVDIGMQDPQRQASTGFNVTANKRIFSRDSLRGM